MRFPMIFGKFVWFMASPLEGTHLRSMVTTSHSKASSLRGGASSASSPQLQQQQQLRLLRLSWNDPSYARTLSWEEEEDTQGGGRTSQNTDTVPFVDVNGFDEDIFHKPNDEVTNSTTTTTTTKNTTDIFDMDDHQDDDLDKVATRPEKYAVESPIDDKGPIFVLVGLIWLVLLVLGGL